jgi:hypothetical protein
MQMKDKMYANDRRDDRIAEQGMCAYPGCMRRAAVLAHKIGKGEYSRRWVKTEVWNKYNIDLSDKKIDIIIHHEKNTACVCLIPAHNDHFNVSFNCALELLYEIVNDLIQSGKLQYAGEICKKQ